MCNLFTNLNNITAAFLFSYLGCFGRDSYIVWEIKPNDLYILLDFATLVNLYFLPNNVEEPGISGWQNSSKSLDASWRECSMKGRKRPFIGCLLHIASCQVPLCDYTKTPWWIQACHNSSKGLL